MSHGVHSWLPLPFPVFFPLLWLFVCTLLGWASGYWKLRKRYPPVEEPREESFWLVSGEMQAVTYRSALMVGFGARGLHLGPLLPFRLTFGWGVPCIPWAELRGALPPLRRGWGWSVSYDFEIPSMNLRFSLHGKAGAALSRRLGIGGLG